jgi:hypothetical protein
LSAARNWLFIAENIVTAKLTNSLEKLLTIGIAHYIHMAYGLDDRDSIPGRIKSLVFSSTASRLAPGST